MTASRDLSSSSVVHNQSGTPREWPVLYLPLSMGKAQLSFVPHTELDGAALETATLDIAEGEAGRQTFTCSNIARAEALRLYRALGEWLMATGGTS